MTCERCEELKRANAALTEAVDIQVANTHGFRDVARRQAAIIKMQDTKIAALYALVAAGAPFWVVIFGAGLLVGTFAAVMRR